MTLRRPDPNLEYIGAGFLVAWQKGRVLNIRQEGQPHNLGPWGYHLILDCAECRLEVISDPHRIAVFSDDLVERINMKAFGPPLIRHFAEHKPEAAGYSLVQLIETSSITGHFSDMTGDAYIDIFSCRNFNPEVAKDVVKKHLAPIHVISRFLIRQVRRERINEVER